MMDLPADLVAAISDPLAMLRELDRFEVQNKLLLVYPEEGPLRRGLYLRHMEFFRVSADRAQVAFVASNRSGKTFALSYAAACHLTGWYPVWWDGRRFPGPITAWAAGEDAKSVRESLQLLLLGPVGQFGTGLIPKAALKRVVMRQGVADSVDLVEIVHALGGVSRLLFKAYEQGRESFQASTIDLGLEDEEPPLPIHNETLTRTMSTVPGKPNGLLLSAFTPLKGVSDTVLTYLPGGVLPQTEELRDRAWGKSKWVVTAAWGIDTPHLSAEAQAELASSYSPHELAARTRGVPQLGAGAIYPIQESEIVCEPFELPVYFRHVYALDVGWQRTAAVWGAYDAEGDVLYLYSEHYQGEQQPAVHAEAIKARGEWIPGVIDSAARGRSQEDGSQLMQKYQALGLRVSAVEKTWKGSRPPVEASIYEVWGRLSSGRLKVFRTLSNWLMEFRLYRRNEKGRVDPANQYDHLMDATRYMVVSGLPLAAPRPRNQWERLLNRPVARNHTYDYEPMAEAWGGAERPHSPWRRAG